MTQPPGPQGPYQQYPQDPNQQPGGFGPPPGAQQPGGYPQQPGYQQPPPGYQQPQQSYQQGYGEAPQKKSKLPWILGGVGALIVIGGAVLLIVLLGGDDGGGGGGGEGKGNTPEATANAFASAFNDRNADAVEALLCKSDTDMIASRNENLQDTAFKNVPDGATIAVDRVEKQGDAKALAHFKVTGAEQGAAPTGVPLAQTDGAWEVCFTGAMGSPPAGNGAESAPAPPTE